MKKNKHHTYRVDYYREGDFLEIEFNVPPIECKTESVGDGIYIIRAVSSQKVVGVGIHNFLSRGKTVNEILKPLNLALPFDITIPGVVEAKAAGGREQRSEHSVVEEKGPRDILETSV